MKYRLPYRLLMAAYAVAFVAGPAQSDDGYLLKRAYKAGESDKFKTTITVETGSEEGVPKFKIDMTILTTETVKEITSQGSTVLETKVDKSLISVLGQEREGPGSGETVKTVIDKEGRIVPEKGARGGVNPAQMLGMTRTTFFPDKPLKVGDEHKFESETKEDGKTIQSTKGSATVVGVEKKGAELPADSIKVKFVFDSIVNDPTGEQKVRVDGHVWIEPGTGKVLMGAGKITGIKHPNLGQPTIAYKMVRTGSSDAKASASQ